MLYIFVKMTIYECFVGLTIPDVKLSICLLQNKMCSLTFDCLVHCYAGMKREFCCERFVLYFYSILRPCVII